MKILTPLAMSILISSSALAMNSSEKSFRPSDSRDVRELQIEVKMLRQDVQKLEALILKMQRTLNTLAEDSNGNNSGNSSNDDNKWGCYMNDIRAGGIYATGRTEAEARGKALASCTDKRGTCWDDNLKCTSSE
ncbi:hypothetical protein [Gynuella sp.]|uniref:hypothetical protein n=1 Tax=Gynuella sp. TaxID=2969146 RepID=UPI003D122EA2